MPGDAHELTFCCYKKRPFLTNENARSYLIDSLNASRVRYHFDIWAWVFMPEHVHILIYPLDELYSISSILRSIKQPMAGRMIWHLKKFDLDSLKFLETGLTKPKYRFWQDGGGYDRNYCSTNEIRKQIDYIHNNPVRRGLVKEPCEWELSSAKDWIKGEAGKIVIDRESVPMI